MTCKEKDREEPPATPVPRSAMRGKKKGRKRPFLESGSDAPLSAGAP